MDENTRAQSMAPSDQAADPARPLSAAAQRALAEAAERKRQAEPAAAPVLPVDGAGTPKEIDGRGGLEPVRYGDWEVKGLATDF